jgi:magnesium-transporting ATPase (P-type)
MGFTIHNEYAVFSKGNPLNSMDGVAESGYEPLARGSETPCNILWNHPTIQQRPYGYWSTGHAAWQTMVFTTLALSRMGMAETMRSDRDSLFRIGLLSNRPLLGAVVLTFGLQMAVVYIPFLQTVFQTTSLSAIELAISVALSAIVFGAIELEKTLIRKKPR